MLIRRILAAALAAAAFAVPTAAFAQPADIHSSMAIAAAKERQQQEQKQRLDLRSPDTKDAALHPRKLVVVNAPGATATDSQAKSTPVAPGQPTWAVNPKPLTPPAQPATATASDDGTDWVAIGAGVGLTLLVFGGVAAFARNRPLPTRAA